MNDAIAVDVEDTSVKLELRQRRTWYTQLMAPHEARVVALHLLGAAEYVEARLAAKVAGVAYFTRDIPVAPIQCPQP